MAESHTTAKLAGPPDESGWVQFYEFAPSSTRELAKGKLFLLVCAKGKGFSVNYFTAAREVASSLHQNYYSSQLGPYNALLAAVKTTAKEFGKKLGDLQVVAISDDDNMVYLVAVGGASIKVLRSGKLATILHSEGVEPISASGKLVYGDVFVLSTVRAVEQFSDEVVLASFTAGGLDGVVGLLAQSMGFHESSGDLGVVFVRVSDDKSTEVMGLARNSNFQELGLAKPKGQIVSRLYGIKSLLTRAARSMPPKRVTVVPDIVPQEVKDNKKRTFSVGVLLLLLLFISIGFGLYQKATNTKKEAYEDVLIAATHEYEEALNLFSLNPDRSRELFASSQKKADELVNKGVKDEGLSKLIALLAESKQTVLGVYDVTPDLFLNLNLVTDGFEASQMGVSANRIAILDANADRAVSVTLGSKNTQSIAGKEELEGVDALIVYDDANYGVTSAAVFELGESEVVVAREWSGNLPPTIYAGNLYAIDESEQTIWRYPGIASGFGARVNWLHESVQPDFSNVVSWAIDGAIWLLKDDGSIDKYLGGAPQGFEIKGLANESLSFGKIYTNDELAFLYLLDKPNGRILVLTKEGDYKAQYNLDLAQVIDFTVSESEKIAILLTKDKLLSFELGHL